MIDCIHDHALIYRTTILYSLKHKQRTEFDVKDGNLHLFLFFLLHSRFDKKLRIAEHTTPVLGLAGASRTTVTEGPSQLIRCQVHLNLINLAIVNAA